MYNNRIINSTSKMKTTWNIIKAETNRLKGPTNTTINIYQNSLQAFNKYFLSISEILFMILDAKTKKVTTLTKIQTTIC